MSSPAHAISLREKLSYGVGDFANSLTYNAAGTYLMFFYTETLRISAYHAGLLVLLARIWDAFVDPTVGILADRTRGRLGRFRPWILYGSLPLVASAVLAFSAPPLSGGAMLLWAYVTHFLLMTLYSVVSIPYSALPTVMTRDTVLRAKLTSYRMTGSFLGGICLNIVFVPLTAWFAARSAMSGGGYAFAMATCGALALVGYWACAGLVRERVQPSATSFNLKADITAALGTRAWWWLLALGVIMFSLMCFPFYSGLYFLKYVQGDGGLAPYFFTSATIGMLLGSLTALSLVGRIDRKVLAVIGSMVSAAGSLGIFILPIGHIAPLCILSAASVFAIGTGAPVLWALVGDCADTIEQATHRSVVGFVTSAVSFSMKVGLGVGGATVGILLSVGGFVANAQQSATTLTVITAMISIVPLIGNLLFAVFILTFPSSRGAISTQAAYQD